MGAFMNELFPPEASYIKDNHYLLEPISMVAKMVQNNEKDVTHRTAQYVIDLDIENFSFNLEKDQFDNIIQLGEAANEYSSF